MTHSLQAQPQPRMPAPSRLAEKFSADEQPMAASIVTDAKQYGARGLSGRLGRTASAGNGAALADIRQAVKQRRHFLAITDPQPVAHVSAVWQTAAQAAVIGIFLILFITALDLARAMLLPAASAFVIGLMLGPLSARAKAYGFPSLITAIALWLLVVIVFYGVIILLSAPALNWIAKAPETRPHHQGKTSGPRSAAVGVASPARRRPSSRRESRLD